MVVRAREAIRAAASSTLATSVRTHFTLLRYLTTGGIVGLIDLATLNLVITTHATTLYVATILAYLVSAFFHFTINKIFTFRNADRSTVHLQVGTYAIVSVVCLLTTIAIVEGFAHVGLSPLLGKAVGIVVNVPLGFYCNRRFTFGGRGGSRVRET